MIGRYPIVDFVAVWLLVEMLKPVQDGNTFCFWAAQNLVMIYNISFPISSIGGSDTNTDSLETSENEGDDLFFSMNGLMTTCGGCIAAAAFRVTSTFSWIGTGSEISLFWIMMPFATWIVPLPESVSSEKSWLSQTTVVGMLSEINTSSVYIDSVNAKSCL